MYCSGVWRHIVVPIHVVPVHEIILDSASTSTSNSDTNSKLNSGSMNVSNYSYFRRIRTRSNSPLTHKILNKTSNSANNNTANINTKAKLSNWYAINWCVEAIGSVTVWQLVV
ncbi:unnamed protein product [Oppiella nova]|uniref:Uncharacterized protein n=1 Tax=Oppiella nova TaxID=334625 RepID=A0A7R9MRQ4_9ACAR|nr:unnamed protein product [Oppiella nova]CAG2182332.1 unnamed protein product [Oppiella nova]